MTGHRMEAAVESTVAKGITRFVVPLLLTAIGILGGVAYNSIKSDMTDFKSNQGKQNENIYLMQSDVRDLSTIMTARVIRQIESDSKRIDDHEKRLQTIERTVRTP